MIPASTSGTKQRPMTAPERATACASGDSRPIRWTIASPSVSGTAASRIARLSVRCSSSSAPSSSSMWSGTPSVRSWTASTTAAGAGSPVPRITVVMVAICSRVNGASRASSAMRWESCRARHGRRMDVGTSSSVRYAPTRRSGRSRVARASSVRISRLRSSAHWRSSNQSIRGRSAAATIRSTARSTRVRLRGALASNVSSTRRRSSRPRSANARSRVIVLARSSSEAAGTSRSCGATSPALVRKPAASAFRSIARISRVFPIPASPATSRNWPRPRAAAAIRRSAWSRRSSRPTRIGERRGPNRVIVASLAPVSRPASVERPMRGRSA